MWIGAELICSKAVTCLFASYPCCKLYPTLLNNKKSSGSLLKKMYVCIYLYLHVTSLIHIILSIIKGNNTNIRYRKTKPTRAYEMAGSPTSCFSNSINLKLEKCIHSLGIPRLVYYNTYL